MQVILKKDIPSVGRIGEICKVKPGYARNFLIPQGLAVSASTGSLRALEHQKRLVELHKQAAKKESEAVAEKIKGTEITVKKRVNPSGLMYGSVLSQDVAKELEKKKFDIDRRDIEMEPITEAGQYEVRVRLAGDVFTTIKLSVEAIAEKQKTAKKKPKATEEAAATAQSEKSETSAEEQAE